MEQRVSVGGVLRWQQTPRKDKPMSIGKPLRSKNTKKFLKVHIFIHQSGAVYLCLWVTEEKEMKKFDMRKTQQRSHIRGERMARTAAPMANVAQ